MFLLMKTEVLTHEHVCALCRGIQIGVRRIRTVTRRDTMGSTAPAIDYVAAEIHKTDLPATFTVGDGETLGNNVNKPLESNTLYDIYLGSVSRTSQSVSRMTSVFLFIK